MSVKPTTLTEGSIWKSLLFFAIPIMLSNLLQQMYNTVDSIVVGNWAGSQALAAVGSAGALINLLVGLFLGISTGAGIVYATYYGAGDSRNLRRVINNSILLGIASGLFLTVVGVVFTPQLLRLMNTPDDVFDLSVTYLRVYFSGMVVMIVYNVGAGLIRAGGDSKRPLLYLIISGALNLVLDILFVAGFGMGVAGAALATVLSQACSAVLVIVHMMRLPKEYRLRLRTLRFDKVVALQIIRLAVPCGLQSSMFNIANLLVQVKINSFGSVAMAGVAAYTKIDGFVYTPTQAQSLAISTFVSQNLGAGKPERVRRGIRCSLVLAVSIALTLCASMLLFGKYALYLFTDDAEVVEFGMKMMYIMASFSWTFAPGDMLGGAMRGAGAATQITVINALCICVFRILWLSLLLPVWHDIRMVFMCYPASWLLCTGCMAIYYLKGNWHSKSVTGA